MSAFSLNGFPVDVGDHEHLLAALRDELGVFSAKDGCSPSGQCGCCVVLVDGKAMVSCQTSLEKATGKEITTLEGLDPEERQRFATTFAQTGALQCGFCTPGIVMRAKALIDKNGAELSRDKAARHLGGHLCRCTGYIKILDAVEALATGTPTEANVEIATGVGSRAVRYEGEELTLGVKDFVADNDDDKAHCTHTFTVSV